MSKGKWEYKIIFSDGDLEDALNLYGKEGWEVASVCPTTAKYMFVLKRKVDLEIVHERGKTY